MMEATAAPFMPPDCLSTTGGALGGGQDAFHRVPDFGLDEWDAVESMLKSLWGARPAGRSGAVGRVIKPAF
jgi:hypothetical protein